MFRTMLQAKLHGVTVTHANLLYEGSCGIDAKLIEASGMRRDQHIDIYNVSNGERFSTYIIEEPPGSGHITLNGAAARKAHIGDRLIIVAYSIYDEAEIISHKPRVILVDDGNRVRR